MPQYDDTDFPLVLSPNLGCPCIISREEHNEDYTITLVIAGRYGESSSPLKDVFNDAFSLRRSYHETDRPESFDLLIVDEPEEIRDWNLLPDFRSPEETLHIINSELHYNALGEGTRYWKVNVRVDISNSEFDSLLRNHGPKLLPCLYDLVFLDRQNMLERVNPHSIQFTDSKERECRFIHLTDLHLAKRNDEILGEVLKGSLVRDRSEVEKNFINFNNNYRKFISIANELADKGELDFVVITGDMVDFSFHGWDDGPNTDENNWKTFINISTGQGAEETKDNSGLKVAMFTTTGNHDWRLHPYDPAATDSYGLEKKEFKQYQYKAFDSSEYPEDRRAKAAEKLKSGTYDRLNMDAMSVQTRAISFISKYLSKWYANLIILLGLIPGFTGFDVNSGWELTGLIDLFGELVKDDPAYELELYKFFVAVSITLMGIIFVWLIKYFINKKVINKFIDFIVDNPLHAEANALHFYMKHINPYFDYAISYGRHNFIFMDTGSDVFNGQLLDDKTISDLKRMSIEDNIIGMSPDSRAFDSAQCYYNWSQIVWLEKVLSSIKTETPDSSRIFIFLHAPPINPPGHVKWEDLRENRARPIEPKGFWKRIISWCVKTWKLITGEKAKLTMWIPEEECNLTYGSINHYLSQFFHMCAGRKMSGAKEDSLPKVDLVFSGHAHRNLEFRITLHQPEGQREPDIRIFSDDYSKDIKSISWDNKRPFIVQTAACGLGGQYDAHPPYYRRVELDENGNISEFKVYNGNEEVKLENKG